MHSGATIGGPEAGRPGDIASPARVPACSAHAPGDDIGRPAQARSTILVFFFPVRTIQ